MPRRKLNYTEGDWFEVPLRDAPGVGVGLAACIDKKGGIIGYFYLLPARPTLAQLAKLRPDQAVDVHHVGDLGLLDGKWTVLGQVPGWNRDLWQAPTTYAHQDIVSGQWYLRHKQDPFGLHDREEKVSEKQAAAYWSDGVSGSGAVESYLSHLARQVKQPLQIQRKRPLVAAHRVRE